MVIAGIDTGKRGAIVVVDTESTWAWSEKLAYDKNKLIKNRIGNRFASVDRIVIERIKGRGGWSAKTIFGMGFYYGQIMREIAGTGRPFGFVQPEVWTRLIHRDVLIKGTAKQKTLAAYHMFFPHDPIGITKAAGARPEGYHDGLIDALMIACYHIINDNGTIQAWTFQKQGRALKCL